MARGKIIQNPSWMQSQRNRGAVEQMLKQMESIILLPPRPGHGLHDELLYYLDFIDALLKSDSGAQPPSKCLQIEQVVLRRFLVLRGLQANSCASCLLPHPPIVYGFY
jgi:hypothetical protein